MWQKINSNDSTDHNKLLLNWTKICKNSDASSSTVALQTRITLHCSPDSAVGLNRYCLRNVQKYSIIKLQL